MYCCQPNICHDCEMYTPTLVTGQSLALHEFFAIGFASATFIRHISPQPSSVWDNLAPRSESTSRIRDESLLRRRRTSRVASSWFPVTLCVRRSARAAWLWDTVLSLPIAHDDVAVLQVISQQRGQVHTAHRSPLAALLAAWKGRVFRCIVCAAACPPKLRRGGLSACALRRGWRSAALAAGRGAARRAMAARCCADAVPRACCHRALQRALVGWCRACQGRAIPPPVAGPSQHHTGRECRSTEPVAGPSQHHTGRESIAGHMRLCATRAR